MAIKQINIHSSVYIPACNCEDVVLCAPEDPWAARTVSGYPFIYGKVVGGGRGLGGGPQIEFDNARCDDQYQYTFQYDDSQLLNDPVFGTPWKAPCDGSLFPYACVISGLVSGLSGSDESCSGSSKLVEQASHGLGSAGDLVPVKNVAGSETFSLATYSDASDVATMVARIVDANSFYLLGHGFHLVSSHGYTPGVLQAGSAPGAFVSAATLTTEDYIQNAFMPLTASCIYVNLEEAQSPCSCCAGYIQVGGDTVLRDALNDVGTNGPLVVVVDGAAASGYRPAVAEDLAATGPIFMVSKIIDVDGSGGPDAFTIILNGCHDSDVLDAGVAYAVVSQSLVDGGAIAGTIVPVSELDEADDVVCVGATSFEGCLHVNISVC